MYKVKTFGTDIQPFKTMRALEMIDEIVNEFFANNKVKKVISISDTPTTDNKGETIGLIRVVCYEDE